MAVLRELEPEFLPGGGGFLKKAAGEGVEEFVVVNEGISVASIEGRFEAGMPMDGGSGEVCLLLSFE